MSRTAPSSRGARWMIAALITSVAALTSPSAQVLYSAGQIGGAAGGGPGPNNEAAWDSALDSAGNLYVVGQFEIAADLDPTSGVSSVTSAGATDAYVIKLGSTGKFLWGITFGGAAEDRAIALAIDSNDDLYVVGLFQGTTDLDPSGATSPHVSAGGQDLFVIKLDSTGSLIWDRAIGGIIHDVALDVVVGAGGGPVVAGYFGDTVDFDPGGGTTNLVSAGSTDAFVLSLDAAGLFSWAARAGDSGGDLATSVALAPGGELVAGGRFQGTVDFDPGGNTLNRTSAGSNDGFLWRLSAAGGLVWARTVGGTDADSVKDVAVNGAGEIVAVGSFQGAADFNPLGGGFVLNAAGSSDAFAMKLHGSGGFQWAVGVGDTGLDEALGVDVSSVSPAIQITGRFDGTVDFDPGPNTSLVSSVAAGDIYLQCLDGSGQFQGALGMGGTVVDGGLSVLSDGSGGAFVTGFFGQTVDFDPGAGTYNITTLGQKDGFLFHGACVPFVTLDSGKYCIHGTSTNQTYSWWLDLGCDNADQSTEPFDLAAGPVSPAGAGESVLASHFALSISGQATAQAMGISATASSTCFDLQTAKGSCVANTCTNPGQTQGQPCAIDADCGFNGSVCLKVGVTNTPPDCQVTTAGCPYNPIIVKGTAPPTMIVPTLGAWGMGALVLLLAAGGLGLLAARRGQASI